MIFGRKKFDITQDVESMSYAQRWRHMFDLGRRSGSEPKLREALAALAASPNFYPRQLALMSAYASGDPGVIVSCLKGASQRLARLAAHPAVRFLDDETLAQALAELPPRGRLALASALYKVRRAAVVNLAFPRLGPDAQLALLSFATPEFVPTQLSGPFAERFSNTDWARIARRPSAIVEEALTARLTEQGEPPTHLIVSVAGSIDLLAYNEPQAALRLLKLAAGKVPMAQLRYYRLARIFPQEVAALLLADRAERAAHCPLALLRRVDVATLEALLRLDPNRLSPRDFARLAPEARRHLYEAGLLEHRRRKEGVLPIEIIAHLPQAARWSEARRAYQARQWEATPTARIPYLAFLSFEEAQEAAAPFISQPDPDLRALSSAALVGCGRYAPSALPAILDYFEKRRNEQDPVRQHMMKALADLPPSRWRDEHLPGIKRAIDAACGARDVSRPTLNMCARLLLRMAPFHMDFSGRELTPLLERIGSLNVENLEGCLTDAQMPAFAERILPLLRLWRDRSYHMPVLELISCLGKRLKAAPKLLDFLEEVIADPRSTVADYALTILDDARAGRLDPLIPELLKADPSWIRSTTVAQHLHRRRQDLLTPFLTPRTYSGRFLTWDTKVVPSFDTGFSRWTARQQEIYADSLLTIARGDRRSVWELRRVLIPLARMPAISAAPIEELAA